MCCVSYQQHWGGGGVKLLKRKLSLYMDMGEGRGGLG